MGSRFGDSAASRFGDWTGSRFVCMPRVSWWTLNVWVEQKEDSTSAALYKAAYNGLLRGIAAWKKAKATPTQKKEGVSLMTILNWIWPLAHHTGISEMYKHCILFELDKLTMPEPPVISGQERAAILALFRTMDQKKTGVLRPVDLAGGDDPADSVRRAYMNAIDDATVKLALGDGNISEERFLEVMCPDGFRGHEDAMEAHLVDDDKNYAGAGGGSLFGRTIFKHVRDSVNFKGWLLKDPDPSGAEVLQMKVVDLLEQEMLRLRYAAPEVMQELGYTEASRRRRSSIFSTAPM